VLALPCYDVWFSNGIKSYIISYQNDYITHISATNYNDILLIMNTFQ